MRFGTFRMTQLSKSLFSILLLVVFISSQAGCASQSVDTAETDHQAVAGVDDAAIAIGIPASYLLLLGAAIVATAVVEVALYYHQDEIARDAQAIADGAQDNADAIMRFVTEEIPKIAEAAGVNTSTVASMLAEKLWSAGVAKYFQGNDVPIVLEEYTSKVPVEELRNLVVRSMMVAAAQVAGRSVEEDEVFLGEYSKQLFLELENTLALDQGMKRTFAYASAGLGASQKELIVAFAMALQSGVYLASIEMSRQVTTLSKAGAVVGLAYYTCNYNQTPDWNMWHRGAGLPVGLECSCAGVMSKFTETGLNWFNQLLKHFSMDDVLANLTQNMVGQLFGYSQEHLDLFKDDYRNKDVACYGNISVKDDKGVCCTPTKVN